MIEISPGIYYETSFLGVTVGAIVLPHGVIFIDAPLRAEDSRTWRSEILSKAKSSNRLLVNLDAHPDRTLGARALDCMIVAHQKTVQVFRNRPSVFKGQLLESGADWEVSNDVVGTRWAIPDVTFTQGMVFHWGDHEVIIEHHSGPAPGSIWAIIPESRILFVGDAILSDQPPFLASADLEAWIESLEILISNYSGFTIISGRGGPVNIKDVHAHHRYLKNIVKGLERLAKKSASPDKTEELIPKLLEDIKLSQEWRAQYIQRLRHGLFHYYSRHYHPMDNQD